MCYTQYRYERVLGGGHVEVRGYADKKDDQDEPDNKEI